MPYTPPAGSGSGANVALSNLSGVAINTTILSDTDNTDDLGTAAAMWRTLYAKTSIELGAATDTTLTRTAAGQIAVEGKGIITRVIETIYITGTAATHTFTAGLVFAEVWCTGQGGGGGGSRASDGSSQACGSGGGAGGTAYIIFDATEAGADALYTVGTAAGAGGSNVGGNGTAGTNSTFNPAGTGATLTGTGGGLGVGLDNATPAASFRAGGAGGVPTGGTLNITGGDGHSAYCTTAAQTVIFSGAGGGSFWGGGARQAGGLTTTANAGVAGAAYGAGGSGSACLNSSAGAVGGAGAVGVIKIVEYVQ